MPAPPELARKRDEHEERDARRRQMTLPGDVVLAVRIDDGMHGGELLVGLVMVDDEHVGAEILRPLKRLEARRAAIDGDDETRAFPHEKLDRRRVGPIALRNAIGNVDAVGRVVVSEEAREQCRGARAVDVIVAEDGNRFPLFDCIREAPDELVHIGEARRIGHQRFQCRIEKHGNVVLGNAARGQHAPQEFGQPMCLADGERELCLAGVEMLPPHESSRGLRHAEECRCRRFRSLDIPPLPQSPHAPNPSESPT